MPLSTGADLFADTLLAAGIRDVFTLVGDHLNDVLLALSTRGVRLIDMRHESGCTHAAEAWSRIHRRPAISLVTGGPGHTNAITGLAAAHLSCCPLIAISGAPSRKLAGKGAFQDVDQLSMTRAITKWSAEPESAAQIPGMLRDAMRVAMEGRPGPVHLTIPVDLFSAEVQQPLPAAQAPAVLPSEFDVAPVLVALRSARRPVVIAGSGLWWSGDEAAENLRQFIELFSLPLFTQTFARGVIPDSHPLCFGYADPSLNRITATAFQEADLVLLLGKRIDYRLAFGGPRMFSPNARLLQVDLQPSIEGVRGDLAAVLRVLLEAAKPDVPPRTEWLQRLEDLREAWRRSLIVVAEENRDSPVIHPASLFFEIQRHLPANAMYSWDGGDFVHWGRAILPANQAGGWLRLGPMAAIGSGLPNAVALQLAYPDRPVILFTGDGSLGFYLAELDTLVRHNLPVLIIVGNDAGWGLERELQADRGVTPVACELRSTRYDVIMQGFGGRGELIENLDQVGPAIARALESRVPTCLNVTIRGARSPFTEWNANRK